MLKYTPVPASGSSQKYEYERLSSTASKCFAWISLSAFSISLLALPLCSVVAFVGAVITVIKVLVSWGTQGTASVDVHWLLAGALVVMLALLPGRKWQWASEQWMKAFRLWNHLFETTVIWPEQAPPSGSFILTVHPHGIIPITGCLIWEATGSLRYAAPDYFGGAFAALHIPIFRHFLLHNGGVPAGRDACAQVLGRGESYSVFSGGVTEMVLSKNAAEVLYVKKRRGVIELAKEYGVPIVPVYAFGTTKHFGRWPDETSFLAKLSRTLKASLILPIGWCGLPIPRWHRVTIVIGESIDSAGDVETVHARWIKWYEDTYAEHREAAGYGDRPIEIL